MSLSEQSRKVNKIFGTVKVYKKSIDDYTYITTPELGDIKQSVRSDDHNGWMICDGRSLSRTDYANLFAIIGTAFGSASGSTFNLPDARGRVLGTTGAGSGLTSRSLGANVGEESHTLTIGEMPSHNHGVTDPGHAHSYVNNINDQSIHTVTTQDSAADNADLGATTGTSTTGISINNTGGDGSHNNMQPTLFIGNTFIFSSHRTINNYLDS